MYTSFDCKALLAKPEAKLRVRAKAIFLVFSVQKNFTAMLFHSGFFKSTLLIEPEAGLLCFSIIGRITKNFKLNNFSGENNRVF